MLRISPKLISVELNRVDYISDEDLETSLKGLKRYIKNYNSDSNLMSSDKNKQKFKGGRFPTQLFTNIKNDRYKYVKSISLDK